MPAAGQARQAGPEVTSVMRYETIDVVREQGVDWLTLNRAGQLNAIDDRMTEELWAYFSALHGDRSCRIVVIRGAGRAFCAGLDLKAQTASDGAAATMNGRRPSLRDVVMAMRDCPQPLVALIQGAACGGGFVLALASDIRIAGRSARMNVAFVKLGLSGCELGTSYFLPRTVGLSVAAELMMTGRFIGAERALATGLVSELVEDEALEAAARTLVADMRRTSPLGLRMTKETLNLANRSNDLEAVLKLEEHAQRSCMQGSDFGEAIAAFAEKREPRFSA